MDDYSWNNTAPWASYIDEIEKVTISDGATSVGSSAFEDCRAITEVSLPDSITALGGSAFGGCSSLSALRLPAGLSVFDPEMVWGCTALSAIEVSPENQTFRTENGVLLSKGGQTLVCYPAGKLEKQYVVPSGVKVIGTRAFCSNQFLRAIGIPGGVRGINRNFYKNCFNLSDIYYEGTEEEWKALDCSTGDLTVHYLWTYGSDMQTVSVPQASRNRDEQDYGTWSRPVSSYLSVHPDGSLTRVEALEGAVIAETYNEKKLLVSRRVISPYELPIFGGFYETDQYYFLVFGDANTEESDSREVIRTVRYTKDWERVDSAGIYGANTYIPFDAGSLRMTHCGDYLYVLTCHEMYETYDGFHHQANLIYSIHIPTMKVTDSAYWISSLSSGYVSHSFNQFIALDGDRLLTVNHGDAYPRAVVLCEFEEKAGGEKITGWCSSADFLTITGECGNNTTGVSVGGFEVTGSTYMTAGNSTEQTEGADLRGQRNIFLSTIARGPVGENSKAELRWVTSHGKNDGIRVSTPHLVKISEDRLLLLWTERPENGSRDAAALYYQMIDGRGRALSEIYTAENIHLSDCKPVLSGNAVTWYVTDDSVPVFYSISVDHPENLVTCNTRHSFVGVKTEPTCTEEGYTTYTCSVCGATYVGDYVPALGHDWGEPTYEWNEDHTACTATRVCRRDESHVETVKAEITSEDLKATCTEGDRTVYTAKFQEDWAEPQTAVMEKGEPLGHDWGETSYQWSEDHMDCTATRVCRRDSSHTETVHGTVTSAPTVPPTCEKGGRGDVTAVFDVDWAETQTAKDVELPPLGHDWGETAYEWSEDHMACTATRVCRRDESHVETAQAEITKEDLKATCTEGERTVYTAEFKEDWAEAQTAVVKRGEPLGHDWGEPTYEWSRDNSSCTAKRVCRRDASHVETAEAEITEKDGILTAVFAVDWAETQTKKILHASEKFTDISKDAWYYEAVEYAYQNGLFGGMSESTFEPETAMSRAMLVTVLWRMEEEPKEGRNIFTDVPGGQWYTESVAWAAKNEIVNGVGGGRFAPDDNITRE